MEEEHFKKAIELARQLYDIGRILVRKVDKDYRVYKDFIARVREAYQAYDPYTFTLEAWLNIMDDILPLTATWREGLDQYFE